MSNKGRKVLEPGQVAAAVSRLAGAYLGVLALWVTWLAALMSGVQQTTALLRGVVCGLAFALFGRVIGYVAGRYLAGTLARDTTPPAPDAEPVA